ncbi:membrane protein insertase YidC [Desulfogranum marinum]|uniref:membrane protein insertase YidC n=1 Tax=Desulfogranum marinum TaxID=453220 RepID=UPI0019653E0D|nr:membrane protein insertase YidC [Desulfogranum marinum]MBM9511411.1 membrane protein insertase YidC [Desulfogranum marinum]
MDLFRAFLAIVLSFLILVGYQYFFVKPVAEQPVVKETVSSQEQGAGQSTAPAQPVVASQASNSMVAVPVNPDARDITIDTPLYTAVISEQGGGFKSFVLKKYRTDIELESGPMQLVLTQTPNTLPVLFSLDNGAGKVLPLFTAGNDSVVVTDEQGEAVLVMQATLDDGTKIVRTLKFRGNTYLIDDTYQVENVGGNPLQISPAMSMIHKSFSHASATSRFLFSGPAAYVNGELVETKPKKIAEGPIILQGDVSWSGYVDNYFMTSIVPKSDKTLVVSLQGNEESVRTVISEGIETLGAGETSEHAYSIYFGPKKLKILQATGGELAKAVNFGWFDVLAKPMLWLLNFFYDYTKNYGIAIILVTVLIKAVFWPVTQKGMKSMKNMQKLQPKVAKLKEKFKDDPAKMNQEMMAMYKTYKVNPVGGCLPMVIQIPFFFALYRVLMAAIELRHAPFMLWINDLSAPDRLWIGVDIPYLHGLPVLTLLMGASMYLQQKMTPTTADPTQARVMQFLPIIFTFMFINFASGLVLYWFINNLLSILQQQLINRQSKA